jgi:hypothetical protein
MYSRRGGCPDSYPSTFPATTTSFKATLGYNKSSKRNLSRGGNNCVFLRNLSEEHASHS